MIGLFDPRSHDMCARIRIYYRCSTFDLEIILGMRDRTHIWVYDRYRIRICAQVQRPCLLVIDLEASALDQTHVCCS